MLTEFINQYGTAILYAIVTAVGGYLGIAVKNLVAKYINDQTKRAVAKTVVQAVEQLYKDLNGPEKLAKAMDAAAEMLAGKGIHITDLELRMLLEAAVGEFNDVFHSAVIVEGVDVEDLDEDQLRAVLQQLGYAYTDDMTREELEAALGEFAN